MCSINEKAPVHPTPRSRGRKGLGRGFSGWGHPHTAALVGLAVGLTCGSGWAQTRYRFHTPKGKPKQQKTAITKTTRRYPTGGTTPVRQSQTLTETENGRVETQVLETLGISGRYEPFVETEVETIEMDEQTTRVVRRLFARDPDGRRKVIEIIEEEHRKLPNHGLRVVRTTSKPDVGGKFRITRKQVEETSRLSPTIRETHTTVLKPSINGDLTPAERITETEEVKEGGVAVFQRTHLLPDGNDRWETYESRERVIRSRGDEVRTEEQVYRRDANRKLSLAERTLTREWKDAKGEEHQTTEIYSRNIAGTTRDGNGRLSLDRRLRTVRRTRSDGSRETVRELQARSIVAPNEPLRVTEKTLEFSRPVGRGETTQTRKTVRTLDANGRYRTAIVLQGKQSRPKDE